MHAIKCALKFIHLYTLYKHTSTHTDTSHTTIQCKRTHKPHMQICIYTHHKHIHPVHKYILHTHTTYPYGTHKYTNTTHIPHMNTKRKPHIHSWHTYHIHIHTTLITTYHMRNTHPTTQHTFTHTTHICTPHLQTVHSTRIHTTSYMTFIRTPHRNSSPSSHRGSGGTWERKFREENSDYGAQWGSWLDSTWISVICLKNHIKPLPTDHCCCFYPCRW